MAYSTNAQVASEFKDITFGGSTPLTDTEVDRFIEEADAFINAKISKRYSTSITEVGNPISFAILRNISIWLVAERVREIMQVKGISVEQLKQGARVPAGRKEAMKMLEEIAGGKLDLSDATLADSDDRIASFNVDNDIEHSFKRNVEQW